MAKIIEYGTFAPNPETFTLGQALKGMISHAPDYHDGRAEQVEARVEKLTDIIGHLGDLLEDILPDEALTELVGYPFTIAEDDSNG